VVWRSLVQLVEAEVLYQRGALPHATYTFKHALLQEAAYQSLLRSTRQQYHQRIAQVLVERFLETAETEPELVAYHYTEAACPEQALPYWQRAGQQALQRSATLEAVRHLTKGLELLATLSETAARFQQELALQMALGQALGATKGYAAQEVEQTYARARALGVQVGETPQLPSGTVWLIKVLSQSWGIADGARVGRTAIAVGAAHRRATGPPGIPWRTRVYLILSG